LPIERCLAAAGLEPEQIQDVVLVGGMTRMPAVAERVLELVGREPHRGVNPDEAVALGAAIQAAVIQGEENVSDVVLLDVTPLSLGVEVSDGTTDKLIPANTAVPTSVSRVFTTYLDGQSSVEVRVVQGERELARDNRLLGRVQLEEIPQAPKGTPDIEVVFEIDINGLLTVHARDLSSQREQRSRIESLTGLSSEDLQRMRQEAQRYADDDRRTRALAEIRNEVEGLEDQMEGLKERGAQGAAFDALAAALAKLEAALAGDAPYEVVASLNEELLQTVAGFRQSLQAGGELPRPPKEKRRRLLGG
jgi:molecular chaperone DnaK